MAVGLLASLVLAEAELKNWIVSFKNEATEQNMKEVETWIAQKGEVIEFLNDEYIKLLVAKMDDSIRTFILHYSETSLDDLTKEKELGNFVESIEVDDEDFEDRDEL